MSQQVCSFFIDGNASNYGTAGAVSDLQDAMQAAQGDIVTLQSGKADASALTALSGTVTSLSTTVSGKASASSVSSLSTVVSGKASASDLTDLTTVVNGKASQSDVNDLTTAVNGLSSGKADAADFTDLVNTVTGISNQIADLSSDEQAISSLQDYRTAMRSLCQALQLSLNLLDGQGDPFVWTSLI